MKKNKQELIEILRNIYIKENKIPTKRYINSRKDLPSEMKFRTAFGSWGNALKEAGIEPKKAYPSKKCIENSIKAHKNKKGFNNKGGRRINKQGYVEIWNPSNENSNKKGYVLEHRFVMSKYIGRPLQKNEDVHHIDRNKLNNDISNLQLMTKNQHAKYHEINDKDKHRRKMINKCIYPNCENITSSKMKLCNKHYKAQWQRLKNGLIKSIDEFIEIPRKHTEETKKRLSEIAKKQPRKNGKFAKNIHDNKNLLEEE